MVQLISFDLSSIIKSMPSFGGTTPLSFNCPLLC
jgi:hypothetical protein